MVFICCINLLCRKPTIANQIEKPFLTSDKKNISEFSLAGRDTITINSNTDWSIINLPSWNNASLMNGSKGQTAVIIQFPANESTKERAGDIIIKSSDNSVDKLTVHFSQAGATLSLIADKTDFKENPAGQIDSVTITCNSSWSFDPPSIESGITVDKTSGEAGTNKIHFIVSPNNSSLSKVNDIKIMAGNGSAFFVNLHFTQDINTGWTKISSATLPGNSPHTSGISFVFDNKIYYGLGVDATGKNYSYNFDVYDPQANLWYKSIPLGSGMHPNKYASCFILNDIVYIGFGTYNNLTDWWAYDPSKNGDAAWKQIASFYINWWGGVAYTLNNKGFAGIPFKDGSLFQFNPAINNGVGEWIKLNGLNLPAVMYCSQFVINNKAYIIGGQTISGDSTSNCWEFDPASLTLKQIASAPAKFKFSPAFSLNKKGYVLANGSIYEFDPVSNNWKFINTSPVIKEIYNAAVINGVAYAWTPDGVVYKLNL